MKPPAARVRTAFTIVQLILLTVAGLLGAAALVKVSGHLHDMRLALSGDDWDDDGWYFVAMAGGGIAVLAVVLGFALVQWRRGASYLAPFALLIGAIAADVIGEDLGDVAGRLFERTDKVPFLLAHNWYPAVGGIAVVALCLYATWRFAWRAR